MSVKREMPAVLIDFAWYQDGKGLIGKVPKIKLPELTKVLEEYVAGGMAAPIDIDMGMVEKMEMAVTLAEPNADTIRLWGLGNGQEKQFTFRSALKSKAGEVGFIVRVTGRVYGLNIDEIERKKLATTECKLTLTTLKIEHSGELLTHIDAEGGTLIVGGEDLRAKINSILGF